MDWRFLLKSANFFSKQRVALYGQCHFIKGKMVCKKPMRMRIEAIQILKPPTTPNGCKSLAGIDNFLHLLGPELQLKLIYGLLKPIYNLTRKGRVFYWRNEWQEVFGEIKRQLQSHPVLYIPDNKEIFQLYSETSNLTTGSTLHQI